MVHPWQTFDFFAFDQRSQIDWVNIAQTTIFSVAPSNYVELVSNYCRRMESSCAGSWTVFINWNFSPAEGQEIENPQIVHISHSFSSVDNEIRVGELCCMVGSFPRGWFVLWVKRKNTFGVNFDPLFGDPVEHVNCIESLLIGSSASKNDNSIIFRVIAHGAIRSLRWNVSSCFDFGPFHGGGVERPHIIHVYWFWIKEFLTGISSEEYNFVADHTAAVAPPWDWLVVGVYVEMNSMPWVFFHLVSFEKFLLRL